MNEIYGFIGAIGSGKTYFAMEKAKELKSVGQSVLLISYADPLKQLIREMFYMDKHNFLEGGQLKLLEKIDNTPVGDLIMNRVVKIADELDMEFSKVRFKKTFRAAIIDIDKTLRAAALGERDYKASYRKLVQFIGTDIGRNLIYENLWVILVLDKIKLAFDNEIAQAVIIDDIRFENEYKLLINFAEALHIPCNVKAITSTIEKRAERTGYTTDELWKFASHESETCAIDIIKNFTFDDYIFN